jgi:hypothetical protein
MQLGITLIAKHAILISAKAIVVVDVGCVPTLRAFD